jgi:phosphoglycerate dehydrogenase-like enzyme
MKIGYLAKQDSYAIELLKRLKAAHARDEFLPWLPGENAPAMDLEVLIVVGKLGSRELDGQNRLGLVQTASAGYDGVDVEAATEAGIWVASAPTTKTGNGESVAEFAVLLMLAASRRLNEELAWMRDSRDARREKPEANKALYGKTACIIGLGGIGDLLVERLRGFGMVLTGVDTHPDHGPEGVKAYASHQLMEAVASADYVILAVPGKVENENMIDASVMGSMKKGAVLLNVGRGILVEESALLEAVKNGHLYAAGLDVVKDEPLERGNPLLTEPRIFVTPHIAGSTDLALEGTAQYLSETLARYVKGVRPQGVVNEPKNARVPLRAGD